MENVKPSGLGVNTGLVNRYAFTTKGRMVHMEIQLPFDLSQTMGKFLPSGLEIRVRLHPASPEFSLMTEEETEVYKVVIDDCVIRLHCIEPSPALLVAHDELLSKENAVFRYERSELASYAIAENVQTWSVEQLFAHRIPKEIVIGFVKTSSFLGDYQGNPYAWQNLGIEYLNYRCESVENKVFLPNFSANQFVREYLSLYQGKVGETDGGIISLQDYDKGYTLFRIIISPSGVKTKLGQSRLTVKFDKKLTASHTCIIYAKFDAAFEMDRSRNILTN